MFRPFEVKRRVFVFDHSYIEVEMMLQHFHCHYLSQQLLENMLCQSRQTEHLRGRDIGLHDENDMHKAQAFHIHLLHANGLRHEISHSVGTDASDGQFLDHPFERLGVNSSWQEPLMHTKFVNRQISPWICVHHIQGGNTLWIQQRGQQAVCLLITKQVGIDEGVLRRPQLKMLSCLFEFSVCGSQVNQLGSTAQLVGTKQSVQAVIVKTRFPHQQHVGVYQVQQDLGTKSFIGKTSSKMGVGDRMIATFEQVSAMHLGKGAQHVAALQASKCHDVALAVTHRLNRTFYRHQVIEAKGFWSLRGHQGLIDGTHHGCLPFAMAVTQDACRGNYFLIGKVQQPRTVGHSVQDHGYRLLGKLPLIHQQLVGDVHIEFAFPLFLARYPFICRTSRRKTTLERASSPPL